MNWSTGWGLAGQIAACGIVGGVFAVGAWRMVDSWLAPLSVVANATESEREWANCDTATLEAAQHAPNHNRDLTYADEHAQPFALDTQLPPAA